MSIIILQVGQCGNQVGNRFFDTVYNDCFIHNQVKNDSDFVDDSIDRFFHRTKSEKLEARGIQIDMEEKVISNRIINNGWNYAESSKYIQKQGSGNNWANGYCKNGPKVLSKVDDLLRLQFERADSIDGIMISMSVAGGTGSGVGTLLSRFIRENYPQKTIVNHLVWPYKQGEISVQSYNAILSVANILGQNENGVIDSSLSTDAIIIHENDLLHSVCQNRLGTSKIGIEQLNDLISHQLVSVMQPVSQTKLPLSELVLANVSHPDYRLLKLRNVPYMADNCREFSTDTWKQLMRQMNQMILTDSILEEGLDWSVRPPVNQSGTAQLHWLSNHLVLRGPGFHEVDRHALPLPLGCSSALHIWTHSRPFNRYEKSVTALTNGRDSVRVLNGTTETAWSMFNTDAFLYQYGKYGLDRTHFLDCFANTEQIIHNYLAL